MGKARASIEIRPTEAVTAAEWEEIWQLTRRYFHTTREYTEQQLWLHQQLALFRSTTDRSLIGMAAIDVEPIDFRGRRLLVIFTAHAIVKERYRGQNLVQRTAWRAYLASCLQHPRRRKFWVFTTFSYKSYLLLPRNMHEFWPRHDRPTPTWEADFMDHYGLHKYGDAWQNNGVALRSPHKRLRPQTAPLEPPLLREANLKFFARANPGHAEGDVLLCLCPLTLRNWWRIGLRAIARLGRRKRRAA